jgi:dTDP-4-amino-4,6-dideoxygalactose transaminase
MQYKIPFSGRAHEYTSGEIDSVVLAMKAAIPLTQGSYQEEFQEKFCEYIGSNTAFAVNNATAALELSAQLCQFEPGDEVIIPSHTFTATAYPFLKKGAKIIWADIGIKTRVVTPQTIEQCITEKTKAIVVVHLYGYCADMPEIMELAKKNNLLVIEDTAQALGAKIGNKSAGSFGDFGIFSFHSHKNITTLGEGGMLVVKDSKVADIIPMLRHNGHCSFDFDRENYWIPAMGNLDFPELNGKPLWPSNYCMGEVECALGVKLLDRIDSINKDKRKRALKFIDVMADFPQLEFHRESSERHNYHLMAAKVINTKRDLFIKKMAKSGVQCVVQYYPLNRYDFYKKADCGEADCPNTDEFFDNMVSFPFHHMMSDNDFELMINITKKVLLSL